MPTVSTDENIKEIEKFAFEKDQNDGTEKGVSNPMNKRSESEIFVAGFPSPVTQSNQEICTKLNKNRIAYLYWQHWRAENNDAPSDLPPAARKLTGDDIAQTVVANSPHQGRNSGRTKEYSAGRPLRRRELSQPPIPAHRINSTRYQHLLTHHFFPTHVLGDKLAPPGEPYTPTAPEATGSPIRRGRNSGRAPSKEAPPPAYAGDVDAGAGAAPTPTARPTCAALSPGGSAPGCRRTAPARPIYGRRFRTGTWPGSRRRCATRGRIWAA